MSHPTRPAALPHAMPADAPARALLHAMRRMAVGGLHDAEAQLALFGLFGRGHRRPLVLLRALMAELARSASRPITVAPACCHRMTGCEAAMLAGVAATGERAALRALGDLLGTAECLGAALTAQALRHAFADLGRPLG